MTETTQSALPKRFGDFEFDSRARQLRKHGHTIRLHGQPLEILGLLLERPAQVVLREELRARLWPQDTFVDFEHSLNAAVNKLREALDEDANNPRFIETVPRRGYRFISAVGLHDSQNLLGEWSSPRIQSLVVLPLENLSNDPEQEYFADGMTDQLITNLAQISALKVISRTSAMRYKGTKKSLPEIARELHVDAVVEGAVMWVGGRVRISAQLIEAPTDYHLWAASYERDLRDVLSMQEEVTRAIASEIRVNLSAQEQARLASTRPIDPEAYRLYLKGRYYWNKRSLEGFQKAIEYFQQATAKDPAYALAYVGLADTYTYFSFFDVVPPREAMPKAKAAAARALEIDNRLGEAHVSLGYVSYMYDWDWPAAGKHFEQALTLNPAYSRAHTFYPFYLSSLGRSEEALAVAKRSLDLDPASPAVNHSLAVQFYFARQFDQAIEQAHKTLELDPNFAISYEFMQPLKRCLVTDCAVFITHDARSHARRTPCKASEGRTNRKRGDRCPALLNARLPKELIQILVSPDALGVASGRESRIRYNSVDVIAGLAYQDRQVECRLACANQGHGSCAIRVHCIGTRTGTPDQRNVPVYRDCRNLGQLAVAVERRFGNAINKERPPGRQNLAVNRKCIRSLDGRICTLPGMSGYR